MAAARVVIVTGGTYGIGRAITVTLADQGFKVVAFGQDKRQTGSLAQDGIEGTRNQLAERKLTADLLPADVSKESEVRKVVEFTMDKYARIEALVNNAAVRPSGTILETSTQIWDQVMAVNLKGMFLTTKAVLPHMIKQGKGAIVNISSASGWGRPNRIAYCASKGGIFAFSSALARDHVHDHIRVNVVVPGYTRTGMTEGDADPPQTLRNVADRELLPQDTANVVAFLLSDEAEMISGSVTTVGGPLEPSRPA